jgi:hypothetical protein
VVVSGTVVVVVSGTVVVVVSGTVVVVVSGTVVVVVSGTVVDSGVWVLNKNKENAVRITKNINESMNLLLTI